MPRILKDHADELMKRVEPPTLTQAVDVWRQSMQRSEGDGVQAARLLKRDDPVTFAVLEANYSYEDLIGLDAAMGENVQGDGEWF